MTTAKSGRAEELAHSMGYFTESDLCALYGITPNTAEAWRKRRKGPAYILAGNSHLYPKTGVTADLQSRIREPNPTHAKDML